MAQKKITDLPLRSDIDLDVNFPVDDGIQSYRVTAAQFLAFLTANPSYLPLAAKGDLITSTGLVVDNLAAGINGYFLEADSNEALGLKYSFPNNQVGAMHNIGLAASVAGNALTISLKNALGSNHSAVSPGFLGFRDTTLTVGQHTIVSNTSAKSLVLSSGSTLAQLSGNPAWFYVYIINNAGTWELAVSAVLHDEGELVTTVAEGTGTATGAAPMYSATARSNVAFRLISRLYFASGQASTGVYTAAPTSISMAPFNYIKSSLEFTAANGYGSTDTKIYRWATLVKSIGSSITYADSAANSTVFTINKKANYNISFNTDFSGANNLGISVNSNQLTTNIGSITATHRKALGQASGAGVVAVCNANVALNVGDIVRCHTTGAAANTNSTGNFSIAEA